VGTWPRTVSGGRRTWSGVHIAPLLGEDCRLCATGPTGLGNSGLRGLDETMCAPRRAGDHNGLGESPGGRRCRAGTLGSPEALEHEVHRWLIIFDGSSSSCESDARDELAQDWTGSESA